MAMTVLPSFQAFLESTAQMPRPLSPLRVHAPQPQQLPSLANHQHQQLQQFYGYHSPLYASPVTPDYQQQQFVLPSLWKSGPRSSSSSFSHGATSSEDEDDDDQHYRMTSPTAAHRYAARVGLSASPIAATTPVIASVKRVKKKYLKERERCEIVQRVLAGEKQAHLAKEFGVSRAAVCYLLKHQMEILSRSAERL